MLLPQVYLAEGLWRWLLLILILVLRSWDLVVAADDGNNGNDDDDNDYNAYND